MKQLSKDEINDILDQFGDWLTYPNIIGMDINMVSEEGSENVNYELLVEQLSQGDIEKLAEENGRFGIEEQILEVPKQVIVRFVENIEDGETFEIPTRLITTTEIVEDELLTPIDEYLEENGTKVRPCPGGYLIKTAGLTGRGSLCTSINYRGTYRLLSNNHVISKNGNIGKWIFQPIIELATNRLKKITGFEPIKYYSTSTQPNPTYNTKDIAWCDSDTATSSQEVRGIGSVAGRRAPKVNEQIMMFGGMTALLKTAKIKSVTYRYRSKGSLGYSWWKNGIQLDSNVSQAGDSGSAYIAKSDKKIVAIHRAGGSSGSLGTVL